MKIYLAGDVGGEKWRSNIPILESFCYISNEAKKTIPCLKNFLLDSGAFTFMQGGNMVDWDEYVERYAAFIHEYRIDKFFEFDIDSIVGFQGYSFQPCGRSCG